jgi:hypothetical protein
LIPGPLAASAFVSGSGVHDHADHIIYNPLNGALAYD